MAIYFALDHTGTRVKIGYTQNVAVRFAALEATNAHPIKLIATFDGSYKDERALHRKFSDRHLHSEWFKFDPSMIGAVESPIRPPTDAEKKFDGRDRQEWGGKWPEDRKRRWSERVRERFALKRQSAADQLTSQATP